MKLPIPKQTLSEKLKEFDIWITPSLGDISDTDTYRDELNRIASIFEILGSATNYFDDKKHCEPAAMTSTFLSLLPNTPETERLELLQSFASTLYLVTGKSDNNLKCQFPLYLRDIARWKTMPSVIRDVVTEKPIPRVMKSDDIMSQIISLKSSILGQRFLEHFITFILGTDGAARQFWALGHSYFHLKTFNKGYEQNLLAPLVIFKVRGSVIASMGHEPEALMRATLHQWGLAADTDYNTTDVIVDRDRTGGGKTRAYDFVLPYKTKRWSPAWNNRLMIQCQFYAGDSGSVSHKNVDQTKTSREMVRTNYKKVRFIEFVDGAGYFSSLNGDLKKLLEMESTASFTQIRSIPIRLRRELQSIGFLIPIEIEHAIIQSNGRQSEVANFLRTQKYQDCEIDSAIREAIEKGVVCTRRDALQVSDSRRQIVRQYFILDVIARMGKKLEVSNSNALASSILIPGYGDFYGMEMDILVDKILDMSGQFRDEFTQSKILLGDMKELSQNGFCIFGR